jgi:hypothetical protein
MRAVSITAEQEQSARQYIGSGRKDGTEHVQRLLQELDAIRQVLAPVIESASGIKDQQSDADSYPMPWRLADPEPKNTGYWNAVKAPDDPNCPNGYNAERTVAECTDTVGNFIIAAREMVEKLR